MTLLLRSFGQMLFGGVLTVTAVLVATVVRDAHRAGLARLRRSR